MLRYLLEWWGKEENCGWEGGEEVGEIDQSSITGRKIFHILFML